MLGRVSHGSRRDVQVTTHIYESTWNCTNLSQHSMRYHGFEMHDAQRVYEVGFFLSKKMHTVRQTAKAER